jgi:hypothetical protein
MKKTNPKPNPKHTPPPPRRMPVHQADASTTTQQREQQTDHTAKDAATIPPKHYTGGTIKDGKSFLEGRDAPKPNQLQEGNQEQFDNPGGTPKEDLPPAPAGMKPNDLINLPPGSVNAPSSFPGGTPPTDVVVPEPDEPPVKTEEDL